MKRTYRFVEMQGEVVTRIGDRSLTLPIFPGVLKHPTVDQLAQLLEDPAVARKYTDEALRKASWNALRRFPRWWLLERLPAVALREGRRKALELMLSDAETP